MRLLFVEDDQDLATTLFRQLRNHYAVDWVGTAEKALSQTMTTEYDLICLDYLLPDQNGVELC